MDQPLGAVHNALQNFFGTAHFPQDIQMDTTIATGNVMSNAGLRNPAPNALDNQFPMALATGFTVIDHGYKATGFVDIIRINPRDRADTASGGPRPRA